MKDKTTAYALYIVIGMIVVAIASSILVPLIRGYLTDVSTHKPTFPSVTTTQAEPAEVDTLAYEAPIAV